MNPDPIAAVVVLTFLAVLFAVGAAGADRWEARWLGRLLELRGGFVSWRSTKERHHGR